MYTERANWPKPITSGYHGVTYHRVTLRQRWERLPWWLRAGLYNITGLAALVGVAAVVGLWAYGVTR